MSSQLWLAIAAACCALLSLLVLAFLLGRRRGARAAWRAADRVLASAAESSLRVAVAHEVFGIDASEAQQLMKEIDEELGRARRRQAQ